jgi:hypothetical protein
MQRMQFAQEDLCDPPVFSWTDYGSRRCSAFSQLEAVCFHNLSRRTRPKHGNLIAEAHFFSFSGSSSGSVRLGSVEVFFRNQ